MSLIPPLLGSARIGCAGWRRERADEEELHRLTLLVSRRIDPETPALRCGVARRPCLDGQRSSNSSSTTSELVARERRNRRSEYTPRASDIQNGASGPRTSH